MIKRFLKNNLPEWVVIKYREYIRRKQLKDFEGDNVRCPICKSNFKIFGNFGLPNRENAKCFKCGSLERHRLIFLFLEENENLFQNEIWPIRVLHFAPEKSLYNFFSKLNNVDYFPCDLFPENYALGPVEIYKVDITNIPFDDNYFDFILCSHVLEHISDDNKAMSELYRVMSKNGSGIFQVPIDHSRLKTFEDWSITSPDGRLSAFGQSDHVRLYGKDYKDRLENVGFIVNENDYTSKFSNEEIYMYGLDKTEVIYLCNKL